MDKSTLWQMHVSKLEILRYFGFHIKANLSVNLNIPIICCANPMSMWLNVVFQLLIANEANTLIDILTFNYFSELNTIRAKLKNITIAIAL